MRFIFSLGILFCIPFWLTAQPSILLDQITDAPAVEQYRIARELRKFPPTDFTAADLSKLRTVLLAATTQHRDRYFMLAGYLGMQSALTSVPIELRNNEKLKRSYGLALVRAGDATKRQQLLNKIKALSYDDDFVYDLIPLLIYTHDREIYDYLIELTLQKNSACLPADPHQTGNIDCGYRMMEYLAPVLKDFPFPVSSSGDLEVENYRQALVEVREWLKRHRGDYEIVVDKY